MNLSVSQSAVTAHSLSHSSVPSQSSVKCDLCLGLFNNVHGLNIHTARKHNPSSSQPNVCRATANVAPVTPCRDLLAELHHLRKSSRLIPHALRRLVAEEFTLLLKACASENSSATWFRLLTFPHHVFNTTTVCPPNTSLTNKLKLNLDSWKRLPETVLPEPSSITSAVPTSSHRAPISWSSRTVLKKIAEGDIRRAVRIISSSESVSKFSSETRDALQLKHPAGSQFSAPPPPPTFIPFTVTSQDVAKAVGHFSQGFGAGPDGLRPKHIKDLILPSLGQVGTNVLEALTSVVNIILAGSVPADIAPILFGANLIALDKKDGGIRPIAIGCTIRRIASKLASSSIKSLGQELQPHQVGFAVKCGAEAVTRATRIFIESEVDGIMLKLDFFNAFNMISRERVLATARIHLPALYGLILQAYSAPSNLLFGEYTISSSEGVQQGDPLAPALFCLTTHEMVSSLVSPLNLWYHDDGTLAGPGRSTLSDLKSVLASTPDFGLSLNPTKCELYVLGRGDQSSVHEICQLLPGVRLLRAEECMLLGAPLTFEAIPFSISQKIVEVKLLTSRLQALPAHTALFVLKNCFSIPKLTYILRSVPTWKFPHLLDEFDRMLREALEHITNNELPDLAWSQACLPVAKSGLGILSARHISIPAYLASISSTTDLVASMLNLACSPIPSDYDQALELWSSISNSAPVPESSLQRDWFGPVVDVLYDTLLSSAQTQRDRARIISGSAKWSGAFLQALPSPQLGLFLDDSTIRIAIGLRFGTKLCLPHKCRCGALVDEQGTHGLSCQKSAGRLSRHSAINDIIQRALASAQVPCIREPSGLFRLDGKKPDGLSLTPWSKGKCLLWDATCRDTLAKSYLKSTSTRVGSAALYGERNKRAKYYEVFDRFIFCAFSIETLGPFGDEASALVKELGRRLSLVTGEPRSTSFLVQRISVAVQRGNAASVLATIPLSCSKLYEIYLIN